MFLTEYGDMTGKRYADIDNVEINPIDLVETIATYNKWKFERTSEWQIILRITGQWHDYTITLNWLTQPETLRLLCTFPMNLPKDRLPALNELVVRINNQCWIGAFSFTAGSGYMQYRYGLVCSGQNHAQTDQIQTIIRTATATSDHFHPALELCTAQGVDPNLAIAVANTDTTSRT